MQTKTQIKTIIGDLLRDYHAESAVLFGSYARDEATEDSDIDVLVYGGAAFKKTNIFAFAEDLRRLTGKNVDAFEISEVDPGTSFYQTVLKEGIRIA